MSQSASGFAIFQGVIARDLRLALRRKSDSLAVLIFFAVVASLFPLGIGPEQNLLMQIAPGMLWIAALLAAMLSLHKIFAEDFIDGSLDQIALTALPLPLVVLAKTIAHWISSGLLLALISPILALQFNLPMDTVGILFLSLLLGTPLLSLIGSIGAGLTLASRGGGTLLALIILPLVTPVLIFGAGAVDSYQSGLGIEAHFSLLGAMLIIALFLAPFASAASIRIALE
ncbi:heme exporter protein CcmB [Polynucleobacter sp. HIN5]|uniref:heme exporter protein CcmB n=1 Tax=Polynucleobacter sp. HIN5 TaxID=3047864 RepID=UPI00257285BE|nr:heme exporter protein CcmB [Polynucleobacter sp. HIN5]BEI33052.1 heme exporter protein CcmB [Polynucleobacter sp. HIN5]